MSYIVKVGFDEGARRYFVLHSEIPGLNVEAETFEEFIDAARDMAPDLLEPPERELVICFEREVVQVADALSRPRRRSFAEALASMPNVGVDADFERADSEGATRGVFD